MKKNINTSSLYLSKLHKDILSIMDEVDSICRCNNLKYYLIGGTLLGAVRHKGFIPWDDDLDIVMPREDMNRLLEIISSNKSGNLRVDWFTTEPTHYNAFSKVSIVGTLFDEGVQKKPFEIFVDIFPLDLCGGYNKDMEIIKKSIQRYSYISYARNTVFSMSMWNLMYLFLGLFCSQKACYRRQIKAAYSASEFGKTHYANFGSQYSIKKQTMPIEWYGEGAELEFEGRMYKVPTEYLKVITSIFGQNYMQLPPEDKRRTHYPVRVRFSDGSEMAFERPKHKVGVNDW